MLVACCSSTYYLALPISLNSLDREGARLLSPCGSKITSKPDAGPDNSVPDDALELKCSSGSSTRTHAVTMCLSLMISSGAPVGAIGTVSHVGLIFYFGTVVGLCVYSE